MSFVKKRERYSYIIIFQKWLHHWYLFRQQQQAARGRQNWLPICGVFVTIMLPICDGVVDEIVTIMLPIWTLCGCLRDCLHMLTFWTWDGCWVVTIYATNLVAVIVAVIVGGICHHYATNLVVALWWGLWPVWYTCAWRPLQKRFQNDGILWTNDDDNDFDNFNLFNFFNFDK